MILSLEEVALRILCAHISNISAIGQLGAVSVREAFALALSFEAHSQELEAGRKRPQPYSKLAHDDNGL